MKAYTTKEEAIAEARRQSETYNGGFTVPRNLVLKTDDGYVAHSVGNSLIEEFGRTNELLGEIIGTGGRYIEFDPALLRRQGMKVSEDR